MDNSLLGKQTILITAFRSYAQRRTHILDKKMRDIPANFHIINWPNRKLSKQTQINA